MSERDLDADVLIVGGGLTGAALACALANGARKILVLEARRGKNPRFAGELIHPTGVDVLEQCGLLAPLQRAGGVAIEGFAVVGAPGRRATLLPYFEVEGARPHGLAMDHHAMVEVLRSEAESRPGVTIRYGARVVDFLREGERIVGVRLEGEAVRAPLTLVAEGRHSRLRTALGIEEESRLLSYTAAVLVDDTRLPHGACGHIFLGAPGPILAYPIASAPHRQVRMCIDLPSLPSSTTAGERGLEGVPAVLRERYAPFVPEPLRSAMLRSLDERPIEMAANHAITTRRCIAPGIALVGDSGGCSHPITAAGMTVCLSDIRILREALAGPLPIQEALEQYQVTRYRFVRAREVLADALYEVFRADTDGTRAICEGLLSYWQGNRRARASSMALLSGAESRLGSFLGEYLRVAWSGAERSLRGEVPGCGPSLGGRVRGVSGLWSKSFEKLGSVMTFARDGSLR